MRLTKAILCALLLPLTVACGGGSKSSPTAPGPANDSSPSSTPGPTPPAATTGFTVLPLDLSALDYINPLGHMTTPFNALPQGRMYLVLRDRTQTNPVLAPAAGTLSFIRGPKPDFYVEVTVSPAITYFFDHITVEPGLQVGSAIQAGQRIATHAGISCCVDFGVYNTNVTAGFINRRRYSPQALNADSPLRHFVEPLRSQLYDKVPRVSGGKDGKHDYYIPGRLVGNWFFEDQPEEGSLGPDAWPKQLAFAYSNTHPSMILVSIGGTLPITTLCAVQDEAPDPATVSVASGKVTYRLFQKQPPVSEGGEKGTTQLGLMIVQMLNDTRIRVQVFPGSSVTAADFTSDAKIYLR